VQPELLAIDRDGVTGVGPAIESHDRIVLGREQIDDLAFALVPPLETGHGSAAAE
jgi:hypothetical protein